MVEESNRYGSGDKREKKKPQRLAASLRNFHRVFSIL